MLDFLSSARHPNGTWGPVGSPHYRITATSLALACLANDATVDRQPAVTFLATAIGDPKTPPMTRVFAWPLLALSRLTEAPQGTWIEGKRRLLALQSDSGGWGHADPSYAAESGAPHMAEASLLATFLSVLGLLRSFQQDDPAARGAISKAVEWVLSLERRPDGSILSADGVASPICSTAFALAIFEWSESHLVPTHVKRGCAEFLADAVRQGRAMEVEYVHQAGRELNTPYQLFTPAWTLLALSLHHKASHNRLVCSLIEQLLELQEPSGAVASRRGESDKHVFVACQFYLSLSWAQDLYLGTPNFIDDVLRAAVGDTQVRSVARLRQNPVILHISDIHWGANPADRDSYDGYASTFKALKRDIEQRYKELGIPRPNFLVVSGDVTDKGQIENYVQAETLLLSLIKLLDIDDPDNQVVIVPGNHDVNRPISELSFEAPDKKPLYNYRFGPFKEFFERFYPQRRFLLQDKKMFQIYDAVASRNLLVLGFNSAAGTDHTPEGLNRGLIPLDTVDEALEVVKEAGFPSDAVRIAVWHHALLTQFANDPAYEALVIHRLQQAGFSIFLHGHIHQPLASLGALDLDGVSYRKLGAGSVSVQAKDRPAEWPRHYQILHFDLAERRARVYARQLQGTEWTHAPVFRNGQSTSTFSF
ncbi:MAG TPA: metallophosphoesterase [Thermoanaerobaculia bacterium]|nr:metallophosphoesterase [Thermoanaerobaculia bacterium]